MKIAWLIIYGVTLIWSAVYPKDYFTWILEVAPALIVIVVLIGTYKRFPLTSLAYILILVHCVVLMVGGHYTYAEVPLFNTLRDSFGFARNNYDKVGHFMQGFVPAIIAREVILRKNIIGDRFWQNFFVVSFCLALSAFYELIEWAVALISGTSADAFLGTQGYIWDTQSDMAFALFGAIFALVFLQSFHNKQLNKLVRVSS